MAYPYSAISNTDKGGYTYNPALEIWHPSGIAASAWDNMEDEEKYAWSQQQIATSQQEQQRQERELALQYSSPTMEELGLMAQQLNQSNAALRYQEDALRRTESILNTIDPTIMESSRQLLGLLRGETTEYLSPVERERARGRTNLSSALREEMGEGYASSTAGQAALSRYDVTTGDVLLKGREAALGLMGNIASQGVANRGSLGQQNINTMQSAGSLLSQSLSSRFNVREQQRASILGTSMTPYAGAQYVGGAIQGQAELAQPSFFEQLGGILQGTGQLAAGGAKIAAVL